MALVGYDIQIWHRAPSHEIHDAQSQLGYHMSHESHACSVLMVHGYGRKLEIHGVRYRGRGCHKKHEIHVCSCLVASGSRTRGVGCVYLYLPSFSMAFDCRRKDRTHVLTFRHVDAEVVEAGANPVHHRRSFDIVAVVAGGAVVVHRTMEQETGPGRVPWSHIRGSVGVLVSFQCHHERCGWPSSTEKSWSSLVVWRSW